MPYSYNFYKENVRLHFLTQISQNTKILDVGPGSGTYGNLLRPFGYKLDCIEIWEPYINQFELKKIYHKVHVGDILHFDFSNYEYLILGDILEHISLSEAQDLIEKIFDANIKCLVAVPYLYEQGSFEGNSNEIHLQPDLTPSLMRERYKTLHLLFGNDEYGYYVNYRKSSKPFFEKTYSLLSYAKYKARKNLGMLFRSIVKRKK